VRELIENRLERRRNHFGSHLNSASRVPKILNEFETAKSTNFEPLDRPVYESLPEQLRDAKVEKERE
jgi:hypothetical protein